MILQAVIDDSRTNARQARRVFMLGGLIASYDSWAAFSDEWHAELSKEPPLEYFKLSQALALKDQFDESRGWTEALRDERVFALGQIAKRHALCGISCTLDQGLYDDLVKGVSPFIELRDPYFLCFMQIVDAITSARGELPSSSGLDYIFDEQGSVGLEAVHWWKRLKTITPWRAPEDLGSTPVHRNDKKFRPLQAADLYAGLKRLQTEQGNQMWPVARSMLEAFSGLQAWQRAYTKDDLLALGAELVLRSAKRKQGRRRDGEA